MKRGGQADQMLSTGLKRATRGPASNSFRGAAHDAATHPAMFAKSGRQRNTNRVVEPRAARRKNHCNSRYPERVIVAQV